MIPNSNRLHVAAAVALLGLVHAPMDEAVRLGVKRRMEAPMETNKPWKISMEELESIAQKELAKEKLESSAYAAKRRRVWSADDPEDPASDFVVTSYPPVEDNITSYVDTVDRHGIHSSPSASPLPSPAASVASFFGDAVSEAEPEVPAVDEEKFTAWMEALSNAQADDAECGLQALAEKWLQFFSDAELKFWGLGAPAPSHALPRVEPAPAAAARPAVSVDPALRNANKREQWTYWEDKTILSYAWEHGTKWRKIAALLPGRTDDAVRNRYKRLQGVQQPSEAAARKANQNVNNVNEGPVTERTKFTPAEDKIILNEVQRIGRKWELVAASLPGRTPHAIRNRYTRLQMLNADAAQNKTLPSQS